MKEFFRRGVRAVVRLALVGMLAGAWHPCDHSSPAAETERPTARQLAQSSAAAKTLERHGIAPTVAGATEFLRSLAPGGSRRTTLAQACKKLSDPAFAVREAAMSALLAEPLVPRRMLVPLAQGDDLEAAWRAQHVLDRAGVAHGRTLHAALEVASSHGAASPAPQLAPLVLAFVDDAPSPDMAKLWLLWIKPIGGAPHAAEWEAAAARVESETRRNGRARLNGRRLVSTGTRGLVFEFDLEGRTVWRFPAAAWSAERMASGQTLLALLEEQRIVQVDSDGRRVWEFQPIAAIRAQPLANGHVLAADYSGGRVVEINPSRAVVWSYDTPDPCFDVERLANGNTLFGCANLVREVTADGQTVHQWTIRGRLNGLSVTPDQRLLVANFGANEVVEIDDDGQVVWKVAEPQPCDAWRLDSGHTLVTTALRSVELDRDGRLVRQWTTAKYGTSR